MEPTKKSAKSINNMLSSSKTRIAGLHLLNSHLFNFSDDEVLEYCIGWMQNCCKIDSSSKDKDFAIETLGKIIEFSANFPELNKSVSFFISNRFCDYFFKYLTNSNFGWACAKICFLYYKGSCGPSQEIFEKHLYNHITRNIKISAEVSQCFALLPSLGRSGKEKIAYQMNWKNQFLKFINTTHLILNDLFVDVEELNQYGSPDSSYSKNAKKEFLIIQFQNYCSVIVDMLLIKYPGPKFISTDIVLELICRGLAINPFVLQKSESNTIIILKKKLPNIQIALLIILNALITTCKTQLLPYSQLICKLIKQTLNYSQLEKYGHNKCFAVLRISIYQVICNWLVETKTGGCIDTISQFIIPEIISDVKPKKSILLLKERKSNAKTDPKNNQESICRNYLSNNSALCYAALKALQYFLKFFGIFLTVDDQKFLQKTIVKLIVDIQINNHLEALILYSIPLCRKALYSVLFELVQQPCSKWPPPTHFAFRIFKKGQNDRCPEISAFCSSALTITTNIIHQQYSNGPINTESATNQFQNIGLFSESIEKESANNKLFFEPEEKKNANNGEDINMEISPKHYQNISYQPMQLNDIENPNSSEELKQGSDIIALSPLEDLESIKSPEGSIVCIKNSSQDNVQILLKNENVLRDSNNSDKNEEDTIENLKIKNYIKEEENYMQIINNKQNTFFKETIEKDDEVHQKNILKKESNTYSDTAPTICGTTPQKTSEKVNKLGGNSSEDSSSSHSIISENRYFLRSKIVEGTSEELKDISKRVSSPDVKSTPGRNLGKNTPLSVKNIKNRPRTRALSKLEIDEKETDFSTPKKSKISKNIYNENNGNEEDDDIIEMFNDTIID